MEHFEAQMPRTKVDPPSLIAEKLQALQEVEIVIKFLRSQLLHAESQRDAIRSEVTSYGILPRGIDHLPEELLCIIFSLVDESQPTRNRRLSLVSKLWRSLVNSTPQLWNQIIVKWAGDIKGVARSWDYMDICLARSKNLLLDVTVDFFHLPAPGEYIWDLVCGEIDLLDQDYVPATLYTNDATGVETIFDEFKPLYQDMVARTIHNMSERGKMRCNSWRLLVPAHLDYIDELFQDISSVTTQLTELVYYRNPDGDDYREILAMPLTYFPSLKRLETDQDVRIAAGFTTLERLKLRSLDASLHFLENAGSRFSALRSLSVSIWNSGAEIRIGKAPCFPSLQTLELEGDDKGKIMSLLKAPRLEDLNLYGMPLLQYTAPLMLYLRVFSVYVEVWSDDPGSVSRFTATFQSALSKSPNLTSLTILSRGLMCRTASKLVKKVVDEMRAEGSALALLESICIMDSNGGSPRLFQMIDVSIGPVGVKRL